jgi:hypothetical protein
MKRNGLRRQRGWVGVAGRPALPLIGMALTTRVVSEVADPLDPARAVRRALADAGRKAIDVSHLVAASKIAADDVGTFCRTALGPHADDVDTTSVAGDDVIGAVAAVAPGAGLIVAVLAIDTGTLALVLRQPG